MSTTRLFYARAVMWEVCARAKVDYVDSPEIEQGLCAVGTAEDSTAWWNMMDTTMPASGAGNYNSTGVRNYSSSIEGITATVDTLALDYYQSLWRMITSPGKTTAIEFARAFSLTPWGGIGDRLPLEVVQCWNDHSMDWVADRQHPVSGPGPWQYRSDGSPMPMPITKAS